MPDTPFPAPTSQLPKPPPGLTLRPAESHDIPLFAQAYGEMRAPELARLPWSLAQKLAFVEDQFALQHTHLVSSFPNADFWTIGVARGRDIGRIYLDRSGPEWRVLDILLCASAQGRGTGTKLIKWTQKLARQAGAAMVELSVQIDNPRAHALYLRLGFEDTGNRGTMHRAMRWTP